MPPPNRMSPLSTLRVGASISAFATWGTNPPQDFGVAFGIVRSPLSHIVNNDLRLSFINVGLLPIGDGETYFGLRAPLKTCVTPARESTVFQSSMRVGCSLLFNLPIPNSL